MKTALIVVAVLVGAFVLFAASKANDPASQEKYAAREAISECRKTVGDDLLPREQRLFARGACEKMEADFRAKYNATP